MFDRFLNFILESGKILQLNKRGRCGFNVTHIWELWLCFSTIKFALCDISEAFTKSQALVCQVKKFKLLTVTKQKLSVNIVDIYLLPLGRVTLEDVGSIQVQLGTSKQI